MEHQTKREDTYNFEVTDIHTYFVGESGVWVHNSSSRSSGEEVIDFFLGAKYTDKVVGQMKQGDFHSFPESVDRFQSAGQLTKIEGGDGVVRDMLKIHGEYKGKKGNFEYIKESDGSINHRLFRPDREQ